MKHFLVAMTMLITMIGFGVYSGASISAQNCSGATTTEGAISCGVGGATGVPVTGNPQTKINGTLSKGIRILTSIVGVLSVIFIIVAGYKFITSGGDSNKVASAKSTILWAIVGLAIVTLAQVILRFVINNSKI